MRRAIKLVSRPTIERRSPLAETRSSRRDRSNKSREPDDSALAAELRALRTEIARADKGCRRTIAPDASPRDETTA